MNKFKPWHLAVISIAVFLIFGIIAAVVVVNNTDLHDINNWNFTWRDTDFGIITGNSKEYSIDKTETISISNLKSLSFGAISAKVNVTETSGSNLEVRLYGDYRSKRGEIELEVKETASGVQVNVKYPNNGVTYSNLTLDIEIPNEYTKDLSVSVVSSKIDFSVENMTFENVSITTVSGEVDFKTVNADELELNSVSGDMKGNLAQGVLECTGVSSKFDITGLTSKAYCDTVSGDITLTFVSPQEVSADTTSGDVVITFEELGPFYVEFDSVSGDFNSDYAMNIVKQKSSDFEGYYLEEDSPLISVGSVSGDLKIS